MWLFGMLRLAKAMLERIACIIFTFCLTGRQTSSCFLLTHILLHHLDNFVLHYHSLFRALFCLV